MTGSDPVDRRSLAGQVAIVTGAGRGIGRAVALSLAAEGAAVGIFARTVAEIEATAAVICANSGRALALSVDVRDAAAVHGAVAETEKRLGPIALLVNNAGSPGPVGLDWEVDPDEWFECIDSTLRGAFLLCRAVVPGMIARTCGRIINVVSITGTRARPPLTATSIAKTALIRFGEGLALQLDAHGVCVFSVHPGVVRTRLLESYGLQIPEEMFVAPERAGMLCARLATGRYDILSGRFLTIGDDLDEFVARADEIAARELYTLRLNT